MPDWLCVLFFFVTAKAAMGVSLRNLLRTSKKAGRPFMFANEIEREIVNKKAEIECMETVDPKIVDEYRYASTGV